MKSNSLFWHHSVKRRYRLAIVLLMGALLTLYCRYYVAVRELDNLRKETRQLYAERNEDRRRIRSLERQNDYNNILNDTLRNERDDALSGMEIMRLQTKDARAHTQSVTDFRSL
jgi:hypothetical protein